MVLCGEKFIFSKFLSIDLQCLIQNYKTEMLRAYELMKLELIIAYKIQSPSIKYVAMNGAKITTVDTKESPLNVKEYFYLLY